MKPLVLLGVTLSSALFFNVACALWAEASPAEGIAVNSLLIELFPKEGVDLAQKLKNLPGHESTHAALSLLQQVKNMKLTRTDAEAKKKQKAYRACWELCLEIRKMTNDSKSQQEILSEWKVSLKDDTVVADQIAALKVKWDRALLTREFWDLLAQTNSRRTISAFCYVLYEYGDASDARRLEEKEASVSDQEIKKNLRRAISYVLSNVQGGSGDPGPSARPPAFD